jgi:dTDP-L-rhamnose 4-epimerase
MVVASSMSIYGEGAYHCAQHGSVYPRLRGNPQLQARDWEMDCPFPGCGEKAAPTATSEDKPLFPNSIYAINKRDHEEMFLATGRAYGIPAVALRYFNAYGTRQALSNPYTGVAAIFAGRLLNNKAPVIFEDGHQLRDFVHVSDLVKANLLVMERPEADYRVFNVGSGQPISILGVAEALTAQMGLDLPPEMAHQYRAGDIRHCFADTSQIASLGFQPGLTLREGIGELIAWVKTQQAEENFEAARRELLDKGLAV